jgi:ABC-type nickel/cobalt efflux system permease component RcnA
MSDRDENWADDVDEDDKPIEGSELMFAGHDHGNDMLHLTIPEIAAAHTLAAANATGSTKARRQAKTMAWVLIFALGIVPLLIALVGALG